MQQMDSVPLAEIEFGCRFSVLVLLHLFFLTSLEMHLLKMPVEPATRSLYATTLQPNKPLPVPDILTRIKSSLGKETRLFLSVDFFLSSSSSNFFLSIILGASDDIIAHLDVGFDEISKRWK